MLEINGQAWNLAQIVRVARHGESVKLGPSVVAGIEHSRRLLFQLIEQGRAIYGVTTGVGALCTKRVTPAEACKLSYNTIVSHACGVGEPLRQEQVRAIMMCAVLNFSQGHSGVRLELVQALVDLLNRNLTPWVPSQGSMGSLTHMAHIGLALMGLDSTCPAEPLELAEKEGLALVNGTVSKTGLGSLVLHDALALSRWADLSANMSFQALRATTVALDERVHASRPHPGQVKVAENLRRLLADSELALSNREYRVQDALSLRAIPQVHGAVRDQLANVRRAFEIEFNSCTDNPTLFDSPDGPVLLNANNAHGGPLGFGLDMVAIAIADLAGIAERRIDRMVNHHVSELPDYLVEGSGLNSGFMIPQYVAASLVAENKALAYPLSVDSIPTTSLQEDHWSMATPSALKAGRLLANAQKVIAIELLTAAQALEFHRPKSFGAATEALLAKIRGKVRPWREDRIFYPDLHALIEEVEKGAWLAEIEAAFGPL